MKKRKNKKKKYIIYIVLIIFLVLGFLSNVIYPNRNLTIFEKAIKDSIYIVEKVITFPIDYIKNKINENNEKNKMYDEYKNIKNELDNVEYLKMENEELKKQLLEMKNTLELNNTLVEYDYINATVISKDVNNLKYIVIDKGENDGIEVGYPVVLKEGLIGKVISTSLYTSTIRLLTANNSNDKVSIKIKSNDEYIYGLLNGYSNNKFKIEGISYNKNIELNSIVTTTGLGELFPAGIVVGKVTGISTDQFDLSYIIEVDPLVDFHDFNYVTILKRNVS
ncbi:MAG: rod shape-determining protein MreC [Firmicutes bacterium]|nr:rod shape-determining protein MreC [Bacillota bacterium]